MLHKHTSRMADRDKKSHRKFLEAARKTTLKKEKLRPSRLLRESSTKPRSTISKEELMETNWMGKVISFLQREQASDNFDTLKAEISRATNRETELTTRLAELDTLIHKNRAKLGSDYEIVADQKRQRDRLDSLKKEWRGTDRKLQELRYTIHTLRHRLQVSYQQIDAFRMLLRSLIIETEQTQLSEEQSAQVHRASRVLIDIGTQSQPMAFVALGALNLSNNINLKINALADLESSSSHEHRYIQKLLGVNQLLFRLIESYFVLGRYPEQMRNYRYSLEKERLKLAQKREVTPAVRKVQSAYRQHQSRKQAQHKRSASRGRRQVAVTSRVIAATSKLRKKLEQKRVREAQRVHQHLSRAATRIQTATRQKQAQKSTHKRRSAKKARTAVRKAAHKLSASQAFVQAGQSLRNRWRSIKRATGILTTPNIRQLMRILQNARRTDTESKVIKAGQIDREGYLRDVLVPLGYIQVENGDLVRRERPQLVNRTIDRLRKLLIEHLAPTLEDINKIKRILSHLEHHPELTSVKASKLNDKVRRSLQILGFRKDPDDRGKLLRPNLDPEFTDFLIRRWSLQ